MIKTFRGLLADGDQNRIRLSTKNGKTGYKIITLNIMPNTPMDGNEQQAVVKIFKIKQTVITDDVDYSDGNLLATAIVRQTADQVYLQTVMFEQEIFNQDIYITFEDQGASGKAMNYYLELEVMPLSDNAAVVSTLRDIRLNPEPI